MAQILWHMVPTVEELINLGRLLWWLGGGVSLCGLAFRLCVKAFDGLEDRRIARANVETRLQALRALDEIAERRRLHALVGKGEAS